MKRLVLILSLLVLAGAASSTGVRSTAASGTDGAVIFASGRDGDADLYAVNTDGTGLTRLTNTSDDESDPLPSPDGRHVLFEGDGLQVMEADGTGRRSLPYCERSSEAWSPDSRHLVCSGYEQGVVILDTVDGTSTQLTDAGSRPSWSPDGSTIAFIDGYKLYVMPAAGGARRRLGIRKVEDLAAPAWSPDSQRVAYVSIENGDRNSLWTIRADGSGGRRLVQNVGDGAPSWSPDGTQIAFTKYLPHDARAVFVVGSDGSGLRNVSGKTGGEYADKPAWSPDGHVLYEHTRFRGTYDMDVYAASPTGGTTALTHPFPTGGSNGFPQWMPGLHVSGGEQLPPSVTLPFKRKTSFVGSIRSLATDGTRAVPRLGFDEGHPRLTIWNAATGRAQRGPLPCADLYGPEGLALAGDRLAWTCSEAGNTYYAVQLMTAHLGDRRGRRVAAVEGDEEGGDDIVGLVGHKGTIVFSNQHKNERGPSDPWLVLTHKAAKCPDSELYGSRKVCRLLGRERGVTTSVDGGKVVAVSRTGVVRILDLRGRVLRSWRLGAGVGTALLRGRVLAVQHGTTVDAYDAQTGTKRHSRELQTDGGPQALLLGVQGDLVVYATGGAIHLLRLSNGHDAALQLPNAAPALDAHLEPGGLFVSWNRMHDPRPGRLAFIPLRVIEARF